MMISDLTSFEVKIVFENTVSNGNFMPGYGFAALIYNHFTENYLLFDTGENKEALLHNLNQFNVDVSEIQKVIISHNHIENCGGLDGFYEENPHIDIYVPEENLITYKRKYKESNVHGVFDSMEIEPNIFTTGQIGNYIKEQALILQTENDDLVILVGCAHPGLEEFLYNIQNYRKNIKAIIGGFHSFRKYSYLEGIEIIGPCFCSEHIDEIQKKFPDNYKKIGAGTSISF